MSAAESPDHPGTLDAARAELDAATRELERLTQALSDRTATVEQLEVLSDALLDLLPVAALVVDGDGRIAALSRGAVTQLPDLSGALGQTAAGRLHDAVVQDIQGCRSGGPVDASAARVQSLPGGSVLVVMSDRSETEARAAGERETTQGAPRDDAILRNKGEDG